jgi:hypothetical protein
MSTPTIQTSFASGEWAPKLRSRVDVQKYRSGASLLRNFYVDYSGGGASTRQGTRYINQTKALGARLIPFQPSTTLSYELEFGQNYIRFYSNGSPILETAVTGGTAASVDDFTIANTFNVGDWVLANGWAGLTGVNGNYYIVAAGTSATDVIVTDLNGNPVTFVGTYTSGGQLQRVYTLPSPYAASDLFPNPATQNPGIKWVQDVTSLIICHPSYQPQILTITAPTNWTLSTISFGSTIATPTALSLSTTLASPGSNTGWNYSYLVTAVDANGQESAPPIPATLGDATGSLGTGYDDLRTTAGSIVLAWIASAGAVSYNIYKASQLYNTLIPAGAQFGFIGNVTGTEFVDAEPGIGPDFSQTPPIPVNPFVGAGVQSYIVTVPGAYTTVPTVTVAVSPGGNQATAVASLGVTIAAINSHGSGNIDIVTNTAVDPVGSLLTFNNGVVLLIATTSLISTAPGFWRWEVLTVSINSAGSITLGGTPTNPLDALSCTAVNFVVFGGTFNFNFTWGVTQVLPVTFGTAYLVAPAVMFSSGSAAATAVLGTASAGNPGVPGFFQQRLMFAAQPQAIQGYNLSQPSSFFNFNVSNPSEDDDAISGNIISEELNDIRSLTQVPTGVAALTGKGAWLLNGGGGISTANPITPQNQTATSQAFNGANDLRPLKINLDILYSTNKGNYVRDLAYNIYANIYTGTDISVYSNHLFFGYYQTDWCWAEEPFKTLWAVRNDGTLLSLGFVKEQDLIGWAHHDTDGQFTSVCSVIETVNGNVVDAVYVIVQRVINGNTVQYVERFADRYFVHGYIDSWSVDCALQTAPNIGGTGVLNASGVSGTVTLTVSGQTPFNVGMVAGAYRVDSNDGAVYQITGYTSSTVVTATVIRAPNTYNQYTNVPFAQAGGNWNIWLPTTNIVGLNQLVGQNVYGTADGAVVGPLTVSAVGGVTLTTAASKITLGLPFLPQLQALPLDLGEPTVQGKRKKITGVTVRVADTLGLQIGKTFGTVVSMKDFQIGAVPTTSTGPAKVTDLVNGDGRTIIDQEWDEAGNYCIQQNLPYPATILGVMPEVTVGDTK